MPAWVHRRADRIMDSTQKQYGKDKGKQVAFAIANQQGYATGKTPRTWKGEPYGTPQGRRDAKAKYNHPSKMQKTALDGLLEFMKSAGCMEDGLADREGVGASDVDKGQLGMGKRVEREHTDRPACAEDIALDHLTGDPRYYTKLREMESKTSSVDIELLAKMATVELDKVAGADDMAEMMFSDMPLAQVLAGGAGGALVGAKMNLPPEQIAALAAGSAGLAGAGSVVDRKVQARALLGRLRRGEGLTPTEHRLFKPKSRSDDARTFPISRALTHPALPTVVGAGGGAVGGAALGAHLSREQEPEHQLLAMLGGAAAGGAAGGGMGYLSNRIRRYLEARQQQVRQERMGRKAPGWYSKEERQMGLR